MTAARRFRAALVTGAFLDAYPKETAKLCKRLKAGVSDKDEVVAGHCVRAMESLDVLLGERRCPRTGNPTSIASSGASGAHPSVDALSLRGADTCRPSISRWPTKSVQPARSLTVSLWAKSRNPRRAPRSPPCRARRRAPGSFRTGNQNRPPPGATARPSPRRGEGVSEGMISRSN